MAIRTSTFTLMSGGKDFQCYLAEPALHGGPGLLLLHAWWGLKPFFMQLCDRLAERGFIVLAPDLRDGQIAQTIAEATEMMKASDEQQTAAALRAARDYFMHYPSRTGRKIGVVGFSMGASLALFLAEDDPELVAATVLFYGANVVDFSQVQSRVLGHFSDVDEWEPYDEIVKLEKKMKAAGVDVQFHTYPGKSHWFVEEDRPEYDAAAARLAWDRTNEFLMASLGGSSSGG